jgi:3'(2'), 5'-bisphosphate nucleotidase
MNLENPNLIKELQKIIKTAGGEILQVYNTEDFTVKMKEDDSPLTIADQLAHKVIKVGLQGLEDEASIISEEHKNKPYADRKNEEWQWMVDPLDGTKEFIKRNGEFTVNIALLHHQEPVLGMVYIPVKDKLYYGIKGKGSFCVENGEKQKLQVRSFHWEDEHLKVVCSRSHLNEQTKAFLDKLNEPETVPAGSSLKFLKIAEGEADIYPRIAPTMEWDTAAADVVLREAGGQVVQYEHREPLVYNKEELLNPFFIAFGAGDIPEF